MDHGRVPRRSDDRLQDGGCGGCRPRAAAVFTDGLAPAAGAGPGFGLGAPGCGKGWLV
jgi:hypothetical protein